LARKDSELGDHHQQMAKTLKKNKLVDLFQ